MAEQESLKNMESIKRERDKYRLQCLEMMTFLEDYGLKWIGGESGPDAPCKSPSREKSCDREELKPIGPCQRPQLPKEIDTVVLERRIEELNFVAEK